MPARKKKTVHGEPVLELGRFAEDDGYVSEFVSRIRTRKGSVVVKPEFGSDLFKIKKVTSNAGKRAQLAVERATAPMVVQRKIKARTVEAEVMRLEGGGAAISIVASYIDRRGRKRSVKYNHRLRS